MSLKNWSTTPGSNNSAAPNGFPEGMAVASLNDACRQVMADVRTIYAQDTIASAGTTDIGTKDAASLSVTGTTTITSLGTVSAGIKKNLTFADALTFTHNGTSLILFGSNITTAANDRCEVESLGSGNWRCNWYQRANGTSLANGGGSFTSDITMSGASIIEAEGAAVASATTCDIWATDGNTRHITGTTTITSFGTAPQAGAWMKVIFDGVLTLTHGANLSLPGSANITTAADDFAMVYADTTTQFDVLYFRKDGTAVVAPASGVTTFNTRSGAVTLTFADISASMGRFASSDQSITASGSLTLAHGLSSAPNLIQMFIKCTTAELGFSVNDVLPVGLGIGSYSTTITSDASNLYVKYPDVGLAVSRKDTGGSTAITVGNWVAIFRAWYL